MSDEVQTLQIEEGSTIQEPSTGIFASDEIKLAILDYISREIEEVAGDAGRGVRMDRNEKIKRQRLAQPESETKDFPWKNASNVTTPLALQKTNIVASKLQSAFMGRKPLFEYSSYDPAYKAHAEALTRHIQKQVESPYGIDMYNKLWPIVYDATSLGTQFVKVPFVVEQMKFNRISDEGGAEVVDRIVRSTPDVKPIKFEDFLTRAQWSDIQRAPWIAVRYYLHGHELRRLAQQGFYTDVELVLSKPATLDEHKVDDLALMGTDESGNQDEHNYPYEIFECYVRWDADGDGFEEDIILHIERQSQTILRAEYNELGIRDITRIPYIDIPGQLYGLGVGDIVSSLQDEADTLHNMRNDGTQLSMLPFVVTSEASAFGQSQELFPGKFMKAPVPKDDIIIHKFPGVGAEAIQAEGLVQQYADDATGASQTLSGQDVGGYNRIGAQGTEFLASQSNTYLDSIASQMGFALGELGLLILFQNVKNSDFLNLDMLSESDQNYCREIYSMQVEDIPSTFQFTAKLAAIADSRASKQQEAMGLFQLYSAYVDKMIQLGASMNNPEFAQLPQVMESISTGYVGLTQLMKDILKKYDEENLGDMLPYVRDLEAQLQAMDAQRDQGVDAIEAGNSEQATGMVPGGGDVEQGGAGVAPDDIGPGAGSDAGTEPAPAEQGAESYEPI